MPNLFLLLLSCCMGILWAYSPGILFYSILIAFISWLIFKKTKDVFLLKLFFFGLGVRLFFALLLFNATLYFNAPSAPDTYPSFNFLFFPDASYYIIRGLWLKEIYEVTIFDSIHIPQALDPYAHSLFVHLIALIYYYFGYCPELISLVNCLMGTAVAFVCYFISLELFDTHTEARMGVLLVLFFPLLFILSLAPLKDIFLIFFNCLIIINIIKWTKTQKPFHLVKATLNTYIISLLRPSFLFSHLLLITTLVIFMTYPMKWFRKTLIVIVIFILGLYLYPNPGKMMIIQKHTFSILNNLYSIHKGYFTLDRGHNYHFLPHKIYASKSNDIAQQLNWGQQSLAIAKACAHFLFQPFVWQKNILKSYWPLLPEIFLWYLICPLAMIGMAISFRNNSVKALLLYLSLLMIPFALSSGNIGTVVRHRQLFTPFACIFAAKGLVFLLHKFNIRFSF